MKQIRLTTTQTLLGVIPAFLMLSVGAALAQDGAAIYKENCADCHNSMNNSVYKGRSVSALTDGVIAGKGAMKPRAGKSSLKDEEIRAAVTYLLSK
jgi:cytochrome c5